jgi:Mn2+/Fe2+ NRAMP family transporter
VVVLEHEHPEVRALVVRERRGQHAVVPWEQVVTFEPTGIVVGARARGAHGHRHRTGPDRLVRERYGVRWGGLALVALVVANAGTMCAEFAGVAAALGLAGVSRYVSVPLAVAGVSLLVLRGGLRRVEHVLLALSAVFIAYLIAGVLAHPDWGEAAAGLVVPGMPLTRDAVLVVVATIGTTLAPWGLAFIQSYAVDKRLTLADLRLERVDVVAGATLTGIIGAFIVIACAATLHRTGTSVESATDAARALEPLAGSLASALFDTGLLGAALLAASVLPLSTAYSVCEAVGTEAALDDSWADARLFYLSFGAIIGVAALIVLIPGAPLISILFLTQALNAVLLLPLLWFVRGIAGDRDLMGEAVVGRRGAAASAVVLALVTVSVVLLLGLSL